MVIRRFSCLLVVVVGNVLLMQQAWSQASPDLRPEISNVTIRLGQSVNPADVAEGCAGGVGNRTILAFDHIAWNDGPGNLSLGDPGCPDCESVPNPVCTNPLFECSLAGGHNHAHLKNFSDYSVTPQGGSEVIVRGHKEGFCLVNSTCQANVPMPTPSGTCNELSAGCGDVYGSGLGCQYVDVTGLRPGNYTLRVELNPLRTIQEGNYLNNIQRYDFQICARRKSSVTASIGVGAPRYQNKRPLILDGWIEFASEQELRTINPVKDGLGVSFQLDGREVLGYSVTLPAGEVGKGCYPRDGWQKTGPSRWAYKTDSGLEPTCTFSIGGIQTFSLEKRGRKLVFSMRARLDPMTVSALPKSGRLQLTLTGVSQDSSNDTCSVAASVQGCRKGGLGKSMIVCR